MYFYIFCCLRQKNLFQKLPNDIIMQILSYFDLPYKIKQLNFYTQKYDYIDWKIKTPTFITCSYINKNVNLLTNNSYFWKFIK